MPVAVRALARERDRGPSQLIDLPWPSAEDDALPRVEAARRDGAVRGLPRRQREVGVCRYYLDLSVAETAQLLEVTAGSVKRHTHRALQTNRLEVRS